MRLSILVIPATRITARVSVVSSELSVRTRAAISQTTGSKLKKKETKHNDWYSIYKYIKITHWLTLNVISSKVLSIVSF